MKRIFLLTLLLVLIFGCSTDPEQTTTLEKETVIKEKVIDGEAFKLGGENVKLFPLSETRSPVLSTINFAMTVTANKAETDFKNAGKCYKENSYSDNDSIYKNTLHYLDIGSQVGIKKKLLVNVKAVMTAKADNSNSPQIHIRAKGSKSRFTVFNPDMTFTHEALLLTDSEGVLEWYHENGAPYEWNPNSFGWVDIEIYGDYYIASGITF